jgi:hypothetical protein
MASFRPRRYISCSRCLVSSVLPTGFSCSEAGCRHDFAGLRPIWCDHSHNPMVRTHLLLCPSERHPYSHTGSFLTRYFSRHQAIRHQQIRMSNGPILSTFIQTRSSRYTLRYIWRSSFCCRSFSKIDGSVCLLATRYTLQRGYHVPSSKVILVLMIKTDFLSTYMAFTWGSMVSSCILQLS